MAFVGLGWGFSKKPSEMANQDDDETLSQSKVLVTTEGPDGAVVMVPAKAITPEKADVDPPSGTETPSSQSSSPELEDSDTITHRFLSLVSSILMSTTTVSRKASYVSGNDSWVPNDPEEIVEVPEFLMHTYRKVHPTIEAPSKFVWKNGDFSVVTNDAPHIVKSVDNNNEGETKSLKSTNSMTDSIGSELAHSAGEDNSPKAEAEDSKSKAPLHHLVITLWASGKEKRYMLSLYRSRNMAEVVALCERCRENPELFRVFPKGMDTKEYINVIFSVLREHIQWKSFHLAAKIGLVEYFKTVPQHKLKNHFNVLCHPEGMPPLLIAIQNDQMETVKLLLDIGADVTAVCADGSTALHVAATTSPEMIKLLWSSEKVQKLVNTADGQGYSPMYVAVSNGYISCARYLSSLGASLTAANVTEKPTPLLGAIKRGKIDETILNRILEISPEALNETDASTGNGVLHSVLTKRHLHILVNRGEQKLDCGARNFLKQTPLHVFARRGDLALLMGICAHDVDIDAVDVNGDTPLHVAVSNGHVELARTLLCLGANPNVINNHKESPRHLAARLPDHTQAVDIVRSLIICGGRSCPKEFIGCTFLCMHKSAVVACRSHVGLSSLDAHKDEKPSSTSTTTEDDNVNAVGVKQGTTAAYEFELDPDTQLVDEAYLEKNETRLFPHARALDRVREKLKACAEKKQKSNLINLLALDGGGIRGLVMCQVLMELQKRLDGSILSYFDWVAATSTGAFIASTLLTGQSLRDAQKMYLKFKDVLFDTWSRPYNTAVLEQFIQSSFGDKAMGDYDYPKTFFTTVRADTFPVQLEMSRSYRLPLSDEENNDLGFVDPKEIPLWRAARRSSAAPTYFSASEGKFIDGGIVSNNPTLDLLSEVHFWNTSCQRAGKEERVVDVACVLSVGTGITPVCPVDPSVFEMGNFMGLLRGIKNLSLVVLDQATATDGAPVTRSRSWCHSLGVPYYRFNAPLFKDIVLDSNEDKELAQIMWDAVVYSHTHRKDFDELAELLKLVGTNEKRRTFL